MSILGFICERTLNDFEGIQNDRTTDVHTLLGIGSVCIISIPPFFTTNGDIYLSNIRII